MATLGNTPRPGYVYDTETDTWVPIGVGAHTHAYIPNTLVDAKGDIVTATSDDTPARLAKGADGTVLVSDSTTSTGLAWQPYAAQSVAGKNVIINGAMDFWQRGTSFPSGVGLGANVVYSADRWHWYRGGNDTGATLTRQAAGLTGFQYCIRMQRNSGNTSAQILGLRYTAESLDSYRFAGKQVTLSFWARKGADYSAVNSAFRATIATGTGTDQVVHSFTNFTYAVDQNVTLTTSWQRFTLTGTVASNINQIGLEMFALPSGTAGTNDYIEITGIQLEEGPVATSFSRYGGQLNSELNACQRYYYKQLAGGSYSNFSLGMAINGSTTTMGFNPPATMRVTPISVDYSTLRLHDTQTGFAVTNVIVNGALSCASQPTYDVYVASGLTQYRTYYISANNSGSAYIGFNSEM